MTDFPTDLFGLIPPGLTPEQRKEAERIQSRGGYKCGGFAAPPGTGPEGETCKSCGSSYPRESAGGKRFWKCDRVKETAGRGSDIAVRAPACRFWRPRLTDGTPSP